jgi:hypothetical protein
LPIAIRIGEAVGQDGSDGSEHQDSRRHEEAGMPRRGEIAREEGLGTGEGTARVWRGEGRIRGDEVWDMTNDILVCFISV